MQTKDKKTYLDSVGYIQLRKSTKARYIKIKVDPDGGVQVVMPPGATEKAALQFAETKKKWIRRSLIKQKNKNLSNSVFTDDTIFKTRDHSLTIRKHGLKTIKSIVSLNKIVVYYPSYADVKDPRIQIVIRRAIEEAWRVEAKRYLPMRIKELATIHNMNFNKLTIKNAKTRWGSCSASNNINLNLEIMRLPDKLIDYILLHELVHTVQKNHQSGFWKQLETVLPEARKLDKELNKYHLKIW
ncbi:MAG: M48 family metallopeptidase [Bacteroidales bacterium]|nr:M48 family metallopeptidase [Bacteroidales bacterium]